MPTGPHSKPSEDEAVVVALVRSRDSYRALASVAVAALREAQIALDVSQALAREYRIQIEQLSEEMRERLGWRL